LPGAGGDQVSDDDLIPEQVSAESDDLPDDLEGQDLPVQEQEPGQTENVPPPVPALTGDLRKVHDAVQQLLAAGGRVSAREVESVTGFGKDKCNSLLNRLADLGYITRRRAV
jgi:hypothetical protein